MDLKPLVEELAKPEYAGKSDAEAAAMVNAKTVDRYNDTLITSRTLIVQLGLADAQQSLSALAVAAGSNALLDSMRITLCSTGIDFSNSITQSVIDQLYESQLISSDLAMRLKRLGRWTEPVTIEWLGRAATEQDVSECRAQMLKSSLLDVARVRVGRVTAGIATGEITSESQIISVFGA